MGMTTADRPRISIIVPCRNEARYIAACLESILATDYPADRLEVLVADGRSDDGTREVVADIARRDHRVRLLDNAQRITPTALNTAIRAASGDIIVRMDAHVVYPRTYLTRLVSALEETGADNVGGVLATLPADDSPMAHAIALGLSHRFGVGNSYFRVGAPERRWVDTVAFGCYRRDVFERIGLFDEELVRNQDDEFNARLIKHGGRILLEPTVVAQYYGRRSLRHLARMFFQYGLFKPLVARKVGRVMTVRQLIPALLVLGLAGSALLAPWVPGAGLLFAALASVYLVAVVANAMRSARSIGPKGAALMALVFPTLHFSYGVGFLAGIARTLRASRARSGGTALLLSR